MANAMLRMTAGECGLERFGPTRSRQPVEGSGS